MAQAAVETRGIYWGIPTYPPTLKGLNAVVFGANGISGNYMVRALSRAPERWNQVVALSRRPPLANQNISKNVRHVQADLLQHPKDIARILKDEQIQASVVNFHSRSWEHVADIEQRRCLLFRLSAADPKGRCFIVDKR
jgi:hypothetical protein